MHHYKWETDKTEREKTVVNEENTEVYFNYNSDMSGEVCIDVGDKTIRVPGEALLAFVAHCYVLPNRIKDLENASWRRLLNL